jgi:hypothetical protein
MIVVQDVIISDDIVKENFKCNLSKCKGACCVEGDYGAPISEEEKNILVSINAKIKHRLSPKSISLLDKHKGSVYISEAKTWATDCHEDGACVYLVYGQNDIALCGIEQAYLAGEVDFVKPISCHLYPIRVSKNEISGFEAWNYDRWDICGPACTLGIAEKLPIYRFLKTAIIRAKGQEFYDELEEVVRMLNSEPS